MRVTVRMMFVLKSGMGWQACLLRPCPGFTFTSGLKPVSVSLVYFRFGWHALENYLRFCLMM